MLVIKGHWSEFMSSILVTGYLARHDRQEPQTEVPSPWTSSKTTNWPLLTGERSSMSTIGLLMHDRPSLITDRNNQHMRPCK